jgi:hypothetical protein
MASDDEGYTSEDIANLHVATPPLITPPSSPEWMEARRPAYRAKDPNALSQYQYHVNDVDDYVEDQGDDLSDRYGVNPSAVANGFPFPTYHGYEDLLDNRARESLDTIRDQIRRDGSILKVVGRSMQHESQHLHNEIKELQDRVNRMMGKRRRFDERNRDKY